MNSSKIDKILSKLSTEQRDRFTSKTSHYIKNEYNIDIGNFDLEEILTFFIEEIGATFYNQGASDMRDFLDSSIRESIEDSAGVEILN